MNKPRRNIVGAAATIALLSGLALISAGKLAAQDKADINSIVRQFHVNYSSSDFEKNGELVDENVVVHLNGGAENKVNGATFRGREEFVAWLKRDKAPFADGKITDHDVIVSGNMAAIRFTLEGTHTGAIATPNGTLPATGRKVRVQGAEFFTFNDSGKLVHLETLTDDLSAIGQLTAK